MSSAWGLVRFGDGLVKVFSYNGTSDVCRPRLVDTIEDAWKIRTGEIDAGWDVESHTDEPDEPVDIYSDYGGGLSCKGEADREAGVITDGFAPYGEVGWGGRVIEEARDMTRGRPDWVTEWLERQPVG